MSARSSAVVVTVTNYSIELRLFRIHGTIDPPRMLLLCSVARDNGGKKAGYRASVEEFEFRPLDLSIA